MCQPHDISSNFLFLLLAVPYLLSNCTRFTLQHVMITSTQNMTNTDEEKEKYQPVYANLPQINAKPLIQK